MHYELNTNYFSTWISITKNKYINQRNIKLKQYCIYFIIFTINLVNIDNFISSLQ